MNMGSLVPYLLVIFLTGVVADIYMHNPRGSNDRNCEGDVNRRDANRLFDSQNNAKGGYACPYVNGDTGTGNNMYYYSGSVLKVEWTAQHGCGNGRTHCDIILQYMCDDVNNQNGIRDGIPSSSNNQGTDRIPEQDNAGLTYGMHEPYAYYELAKDTSRNRGLFVADRWLGNDATKTRQNQNGDRHGFEVPEERDYYPYWRSSPWIDIAVLTDDTSRCGWLVSQSENTMPRGYCQKVGNPKYTPGTFPWDQAGCNKLNQTWVVNQSRNLSSPYCGPIPGVSRENHLGNGLQGQPLYYQWTIPSLPSIQKCVLRIRYNVSWGDYNGQPPAKYVDYTYNTTSNVTKPPVVTDPFITYSGNTLSLKVNTNQIGRTFQDRSYVFRILPWPSSVPKTQKIVNLNVRGKRGNIVQTFPAVEYDFIPNQLVLQQNDVVHIQWVGSNYNPQRGPNDAEGGPIDILSNDINQNARADRSNLVECIPGHDIPLSNNTLIETYTMFRNADGSPDLNTILKLAYLGQTNCLSLGDLVNATNKRNIERDPRNCAKINTPTPYFDGGLVTLRAVGTYNYICSRNNNFSNRDQKGTITVTASGAKRVIEQSTNAPVTDTPSQIPDTLQTTIVVDQLSVDLKSADETATYAQLQNVREIPDMFKDNDNVGTGLSKPHSTMQEATVDMLGDQLNMTAPVVTTDDGLSQGAVAGVAIGCIFAGILIGAIAGIVFYKN